MSKTLRVLFIVLMMVSGLLIAQNSDYHNGDMGIYVGSYGDLEFTNGLDSTIVDRLSVLVSGATNQVFDYNEDADVEEEWAELSTPTLGAYESSIVLNNAYSGNPPDVTVFQNHYMWESGAYALLRFHVRNNESGTLGARLGFEVVPQMNYYQASAVNEEYYENVVNYFSDSKIVAFTSIDDTETIGFKFLNIDLARVQGVNDYDNYTKTDEQFYTLMTTPGFAVPDTATGGDPTLVTVLSSGTQNIASGAAKTLYVGVAVGSDSATMVANMAALEDTAYLNIIAEDHTVIPQNFNLAQNYPNPFNPETNIQFSLNRSEKVSLTVYDITGSVVSELHNGYLPAGSYTFQFEAGHLPSGVYFYTLESQSLTQTKKMILLK